MSKNTVSLNLNDQDISSMKLEMSADSIPDLQQMSNDILLLLNDIELPSRENKNKFEKRIISKYIDKIPLKIINLLLEDENRYIHLNKLLDMFDVLQNVKNGNVDVQDVYKEFTNKLNKEYIENKINN